MKIRGYSRGTVEVTRYEREGKATLGEQNWKFGIYDVAYIRYAIPDYFIGQRELKGWQGKRYYVCAISDPWRPLSENGRSQEFGSLTEADAELRRLGMIAFKAKAAGS